MPTMRRTFGPGISPCLSLERRSLQAYLTPRAFTRIRGDFSPFGHGALCQFERPIYVKHVTVHSPTLLHNWRRKLETRNEQQLNPELFRYADIVGATCIGIATARGLNDIEFDIGIVDEAGQISLPDLLVPLVRTKRAVLVGDHHQLPPFVDREVQTWLDGLSSQTLQSLGIIATDEDGTSPLTELLTKSAFEHLFTTQTNYGHIVRFTQQRRMPEVVADFCAKHFYDGRLSTHRTETTTYSARSDTLFTKPLIFVDTSDVPFISRREAQTYMSHYWEG